MGKIITICGSMRFQKEMMLAAAKLELEERCAVIQCVYLPEGRVLTDEEADRLDALHRQKIDISDAIYVVNVGGYIGEATRKEIAYARSLNKEVLFSEQREDHDEQDFK